MKLFILIVVTLFANAMWFFVGYMRARSRTLQDIGKVIDRQGDLLRGDSKRLDQGLPPLYTVEYFKGSTAIINQMMKWLEGGPLDFITVPFRRWKKRRKIRIQTEAVERIFRQQTKEKGEKNGKIQEGN